MHTRLIRTSMALTAAIGLAFSGTAAIASEPEPSDATDPAQAVEEASATLGIEAGFEALIEETEGGVTLETPEVAAEISAEAGLPTAVEANADESTPAHTMLLPDSPETIDIAGNIVVVEPQVMEDVTFAVVPTQEGAIRVHSVIESAAAQERYEYGFPEADFIFEDSESGSLFLVRFTDTEEGIEIVGALGAPWAVDANGTQVPTHYEIDGTTVTQVVEHIDGGYAYPIVADPEWWDNIKKFFANASKAVHDRAYSAARWLGKQSRWLAGKVWGTTKTITMKVWDSRARRWVFRGVKVVGGKHPVGRAALCLGAGGWQWYRSDASGLLRVSDRVAGCFFAAAGVR